MIQPVANNSEAASEPTYNIGKHKLRVPVIQGGMGVRISASKLAGAVALEGGVGTIASVGLGQASNYYDGSNLFESNKLALADELQNARKIAPDGVISVNCMVALTDYDDLVRTSVENGANIITSGAGLPLGLPGLVKDFPDVALVPIVSSLKAMRIILKRWERDYGRLPDAIVNEEPATAGGHLGARYEEVDSPELKHEVVIPEIVDYLENKLKVDIPVYAAGGVWDKSDVDRVFSLGARGVQVGSRFVCTNECDAPIEFKQSYIDATKEDVTLVMSPAGLPGRAIRNEFIDSLTTAKGEAGCFANCLTHCSYRKDGSAFCVAAALVHAQDGRMPEGLIFAGSNAYRCEKLQSVQDVINELFPNS